jgi:hypothetical protein
LVCFGRFPESSDVFLGEIDFKIISIACQTKRGDVQLSNPSPRSLTFSAANVVAIHVLPRT